MLLEGPEYITEAGSGRLSGRCHYRVTAEYRSVMLRATMTGVSSTKRVVPKPSGPSTARWVLQGK